MIEEHVEKLGCEHESTNKVTGKDNIPGQAVKKAADLICVIDVLIAEKVNLAAMIDFLKAEMEELGVEFKISKKRVAL